MTDLQLYSEISSLPSNLKQEVSDFVSSLKQRLKKENRPSKFEEPLISYNSKFSDILLKGPVFSDEQFESIEETRKSINEWRTK